MSKSLVFFVKAPVPGNVKTRLVPPLTHVQAAKSYRRWAKQIFKVVEALQGVSLKVAYDTHPQFPTPRWLNDSLNCPPFFLQKGHHLGERLHQAFRESWENGSNLTVIIGSDSPGLPSEYLREAFTALEKNDLVLGPTKDGGFYLIGLRGNPPDTLFAGVPWSTSQVLVGTVKNAQRLNLKTHLLGEYFDVDLPEDLELLEAVEGGKNACKY